MRRLAQALLRLRHYLPPSLAPAGQSLTKIETLRLAIRYIAHLSALLGLSEEALARQRGAAPRHCPLCPQGLGCCQTPDPRLHLPTPAPQDALPPGTVGWGSPPMVGTPLELHGAPGMGTGAWGSPPCGLAAGTPPEVLGAPDMGVEAWGSPPHIPVARMPLELHRTPGSTSGSWSSPLYSLGAVTSLDPPWRCTMATGTGTASSCCLEPAAPPPASWGRTDGYRGPWDPMRGSQLPAHRQVPTAPSPVQPLLLHPPWGWGRARGWGGRGVDAPHGVRAGLHLQIPLHAMARVSAWAGGHSMVSAEPDSQPGCGAQGAGQGTQCCPTVTHLTELFPHSSAAHRPWTGSSPQPAM